MLDVSNNKLYGKVPNFQQNKFVLKTEGNPDIGKEKLADGPFESGASSGGDAVTSGKKSTTRVSISSVVGAFCVLGIVVLDLRLYTKRRKHYGKVQSPHAMVIHLRHSSDNDAVNITIDGSHVNGVRTETHSQASNGPSDLSMVKAGTMIISIQVLITVTDDFSEENILGRDRFGIIYKGELHDGTTTAVNRMEPGIIINKGLTEFKSEIAILTRVMHRHLVALLDYCLEGNERLLVHDYIPHEGGDMEYDSACKSANVPSFSSNLDWKTNECKHLSTRSAFNAVEIHELQEAFNNLNAIGAELNYKFRNPLVTCGDEEQIWLLKNLGIYDFNLRVCDFTC
ncbi:hypothetical protein ACFE04_025682 [Oxalis oulophora]